MDHKRKSRHNSKRTEQVGGASDWWHSFNAYHMSPAELSRYTLQYIDRAPMFNPLIGCGTIIPTGTSGITPTGVYLANHPSARVRSENYNVKAKSKPLLGTPPCACKDSGDQNGGSALELSPAPYPGCGSTLLPDYTGVTYGSKGCGTCGDAVRYKAHYSASIGGPANLDCKLCRNNKADCGCDKYNASCLQNRDCQHVYDKLMAMDRHRLWALCRDNHVSVYHMDKETGRLTPDNKSSLCQRLAKRVADGDKKGLFLY